MTSSLAVVHLICPEVGESIGGADLHVLDIAAAQAEIGLLPTVVSLGNSELFLEFARRANVPILVATMLDFWTDSVVLPSLLEADVIHSHGYEADWMALLARVRWPRLRTKPWVATCHGLIAPDLRHRLMNIVNRACLRRATEVIAVSEASALSLRVELERDPIVIPNGVGSLRAVPRSERARIRDEIGAGPKDVVVGYIGRLSAEKRPDLFIAVARRISRSRTGVKFFMVGGGPLLESASEEVRGDGLPVVVFRCTSDPAPYFAATDVLVLPSDVEGTSRVLIEAQQIGIPVVATAVGGTPMLVNDGVDGLLVPAGDAIAIERAVLRLADDPLLRATLSRAAVISAATRGSDVMAGRTLEAYRLAGHVA